MHPDPTPPPPPSLTEIREQISRLETAHKARGLPLSGRIIHVCHHLPVEIIRVVPASDIESGGMLSPPMTPEFKPEEHDTRMESGNARWRIHARTAHTAMISGMRSLSDTHENIVVAWTGEVLLQTQSEPTPTQQPRATFSSLAETFADSKNDLSASQMAEEKPMMVYGGEFSAEEKKELESELERFREVEEKSSTDGGLRYVPVFLPPDVSKGHYEGFCKKSELLLWTLADVSPLASVPLPSMARLHRDHLCPRSVVAPLSQSQLSLCRPSRRGLSTRRFDHRSRLPPSPCTQNDQRAAAGFKSTLRRMVHRNRQSVTRSQQ